MVESGKKKKKKVFKAPSAYLVNILCPFLENMIDLLHIDLHEEGYFKQDIFFCIARPSACVVTSSAIHICK